MSYDSIFGDVNALLMILDLAGFLLCAFDFNLRVRKHTSMKRFRKTGVSFFLTAFYHSKRFKLHENMLSITRYSKSGREGVVNG
ncbi:hypothetical protein [Peribacillus sp. SCS-37]|uniref:hypothetical protein n=1 Tax=Paraperibacillus esterisolvens TaxID=3115296 RepID=UPI003905C27A